MRRPADDTAAASAAATGGHRRTRSRRRRGGAVCSAAPPAPPPGGESIVGVGVRRGGGCDRPSAQPAPARHLHRPAAPVAAAEDARPPLLPPSTIAVAAHVRCRRRGSRQD